MRERVGVNRRHAPQQAEERRLERRDAVSGPVHIGFRILEIRSRRELRDARGSESKRRSGSFSAP